MRSKVYAISFSDDLYSMSKALNLFTAKIFGGVDKAISYGINDLDEEFRSKNSEILSRKRGAGYWLWKPYIILKTLNKINDGDYVIYTDAGMIYVDRVSKMIKQMQEDKQDVFLSLGIAPCRDWVKRDAFILMDSDCEEAYDYTMVSGGYVIIRKCAEGIDFCKEWLHYCSDRRIITDDENECGKENISGFKEHRHDQAILSLLSYKRKIIPYRAVSCVDQPHMHKDVYDKHIPNAYGYTFNKIMELIVKEHNCPGYKRSKYKRIFINTRITNTTKLDFLSKLICCLKDVRTKAKWGKEWDEAMLERAKVRIDRMKTYEENVSWEE